MTEAGDNESRLTRRVDGIIRQLAVANDAAPRGSSAYYVNDQRDSLYRLPATGGPIEHRFVRARIQSTHFEPDEGPIDDLMRLSLYDAPLKSSELYVERPTFELVIGTDRIVDVEMSGDNCSASTGIYTSAEIRHLTHRFVGWLKPLIDSGALMPDRATRTAVARRHERARTYLPRLAQRLISDWGTDGGLMLDTFIDQHRTLLVWRDETQRGAYNFSWGEDAVEPIDRAAGASTSTLRHSLRVGPETSLKSVATLTSQLPDGSYAERTYPPTMNQQLINDIVSALELAREYDVIPPDTVVRRVRRGSLALESDADRTVV